MSCKEVSNKKHKQCLHINTEDTDDNKVCTDCGKVLENDLILEIQPRYSRKRRLVFYSASDD